MRPTLVCAPLRCWAAKAAANSPLSLSLPLFLALFRPSSFVQPESAQSDSTRLEWAAQLRSSAPQIECRPGGRGCALAARPRANEIYMTPQWRGRHFPAAARKWSGQRGEQASERAEGAPRAQVGGPPLATCAGTIGAQDEERQLQWLPTLSKQTETESKRRRWREQTRLIEIACFWLRAGSRAPVNVLPCLLVAPIALGGPCR